MSHPKTTRALRFRDLGGDLQAVEKPLPPLSPKNILIRVHAASINPVDIQLWRSGLVAVVSGDKGMGKDFSGTVVEVGSEITGWDVGEDAFGLLFEAFGQGTFSQYITLNPTSTAIAKKPSFITHEQAASIPLVALTAFACLDWLPKPRSGAERRVIIRGASGGTGTWLIQLAKLLHHCHITAICSSANASYVQSLGADTVIDYRTQDVRETLLAQRKEHGESDLFVDCVGGTDLIDLYPYLLHPHAAYLTIVGDKTNVRSLGGPITYLTNPAQIIRYIKGYIWGPRYACVSLYQKGEYLEQVVRLAERGGLKIEVQEVVEGLFDEEEGEQETRDERGWRRAVRLMEGARVRGKVVLRIP